jgi:hypothetical protein
MLFLVNLIRPGQRRHCVWSSLTKGFKIGVKPEVPVTRNLQGSPDKSSITWNIAFLCASSSSHEPVRNGSILTSQRLSSSTSSDSTGHRRLAICLVISRLGYLGVWLGACSPSVMVSIHELWDRFHLAQDERNADAALCFRHAIEAHNRSDYPSVQFWYRQGETCESVAELISV